MRPSVGIHSSIPSIPSDDRISEKRVTDNLLHVPVCCHELAPQVERSFANRTQHRVSKAQIHIISSVKLEIFHVVSISVFSVLGVHIYTQTEIHA